MKKDFHFHSGRKGVALAIHVIPRASRNQIVEISRDGSIKIRLVEAADSKKLNAVLVSFLASVLGVKKNDVEVVAGLTVTSKLVSILDMDSREAQQKILENLS